MTSRFFVFGSYSEGMVHWGRIAPMVQKLEPAFLRGSAWLLKVGFPVMLQEGDDQVHGHVATIRGPDLLLGLLDEFHGVSSVNPAQGLYYRVEVEVGRDALGQGGAAWAYFMNPKKLPPSATRVPGAHWREILAQQPPLVEQLTDRQREYLVKLSQASGREIVPIQDLSLYRELMKLDLIVDKGRRLALSRFGQEVVRYLD